MQRSWVNCWGVSTISSFFLRAWRRNAATQHSLMNWDNWRAQGLTQHRNWWPDVYSAACENQGREPDPNVLAYNVSYQSVRADLKEVTGSA